jgi:DNA polymerase-3 subunit gamma/tau
MSYSVIARKWRPQTFDDVIGQDPIIKTLKNSIELKRIHHSFIFAGLRGTGKTSTARIFAKALNCENGPTAQPCLKCTQCLEITKGNDIDVFEIDAASNKGVDDIRNLKEIVQYPPTRDRYKIFIIDEAHMLSSQAFNALLKTIEEPPKYVVFILATTEAHKIPTTIRSRCQIFDFRKIATDNIAFQLKKICESDEIAISETALNLIIEASEGSMRDAESLLDQVISYSGKDIKEEDVSTVLGIANSKIFFKLLECIVKDNPSGIIDILDELEGKNTDFIKFTARLGDFFKNTLHAVIRKDEFYFPDSLKEINLSREDVVRYLTVILQNERAVKDAFNQRIAVEMMLFKMAFSSHVIPISKLLNSKKKTEKSNITVDFTTAETEKKNSIADEVVEILRKNIDLIPYLRTCNVFEQEGRVTLTFKAGVPSIVQTRFLDVKLETERELTDKTSRQVEIEYIFDSVANTQKEEDNVRDNQLVQEVLKSFDGEIVKIIRGENNG